MAKVHHHNQSSQLSLPSLPIPKILSLPSAAFLSDPLAFLPFSALISSQQSSMKPTPADLLLLSSASPLLLLLTFTLSASVAPASSHLSCKNTTFRCPWSALGFAVFNRGTCQLWQFWVWAPFVPPNLSSHSLTNIIFIPEFILGLPG